MPLNDRTFFGRGIVQRARDGKCTSVCMARDVRVFLHDDAERAQLPNKAGKVTRCVVERLVAAMEVATVAAAAEAAAQPGAGCREARGEASTVRRGGATACAP